MNRPLFLTVIAIACTAAARLGWKLAQPAQAAAPRAISEPARVANVPRPSTVDYGAAADPAFDARAGRALDDILAMIDRLRLDPAAQTAPDDGVSGELFALLFSLQPDEIPGVLGHLGALPPPSPDKLLGTVLARWAQFDGAAAMEWAQQLTPARLDGVRGGILSGWAHHDPEAAWAWYQSTWDATPEPRYRLEQNFPGLIHAWALQDAPAALAACLAEGKHSTFNAWVGFGSLAAVPERRDEVMSLIAGITDEKTRTAASRGALQAWSASAPMAAAAWIDTHLPGADGNLLWCVAERYGRADPRRNADWLIQRMPPEKRDEAYGMCLYQWAETAPDDAAAWLENAGITDISAQAIASRYARSDVDRAITWAARVSQPKRAEAVANTLAEAITAGKNPDVAKYTTTAGVGAEELAKMVEKATNDARGRL